MRKKGRKKEAAKKAAQERGLCFIYVSTYMYYFQKLSCKNNYIFIFFSLRICEIKRLIQMNDIELECFVIIYDSIVCLFFMYGQTFGEHILISNTLRYTSINHKKKRVQKKTYIPRLESNKRLRIILQLKTNQRFRQHLIMVERE